MPRPKTQQENYLCFGRAAFRGHLLPITVGTPLGKGPLEEHRTRTAFLCRFAACFVTRTGPWSSAGWRVGLLPSEDFAAVAVFPACCVRHLRGERPHRSAWQRDFSACAVGHFEAL